MVVDCGSYFITTYKRSELHGDRKLNRERERERRVRELIEETERNKKKRSKGKFYKLRVTPRSTWVN